MIELPEPSPIRIPPLRGGKPEITMAPLIDVVFLLLIFFMVTTIFPDHQGLTIERPVAAASAPLQRGELRFGIDRQGAIHHRGERISPATVTLLVERQLAQRPDSQILLDVDRRAATDSLIRLMDACKRGGATQLGIVTDPPPP